MTKYNFLCKEGSQFNQILCSVFITMPVLAYGMAIGWMSPMTLLLQSEHSPRGSPLSDTEISWMAAAAYIACAPCNYLIAYIADRWGRKICILIASGTLVGCWIFKLISTATWALIIARSLVGVCMAACFVACCLYIKEISDVSIRGALGSLVILSQTIGNLILYILGDIMSYRAILWFGLSFPLVHIVIFTFMMPESPAFLIRQGKIDKAMKVMGWLRCRKVEDPIVQNEIEILKKEQEEEMNKSISACKTIFTDKILFRAFRISIVLNLAREVCGAVPVLNFAGDIFTKAADGGTGLVLTPNQQAMMLGTVQVAGSAVASSLVEKTGRKPLLLITSLISGLSMCGLASWFLAQSLGAPTPSWFPLAALCLCIFCDSAGLQPLSLVVLSELFTFQFRSTVTAITMSTASTSDVIQMLFFKPLASAVGVHLTFYIFGVICLSNAAYVYFVVPETKMRGIDEIYQDLKTKKERKMEENILSAKIEASKYI